MAWVNRGTGEQTEKPIGSVFVMIGAEPNSGWWYGTVKLDKKGFIYGGEDGFEGTPYATSVPGMFAVGDVRATSVKRVASAVGEGSVVISDVHRYLADHRVNFRWSQLCAGGVAICGRGCGGFAGSGLRLPRLCPH